MGVFGVTTNRKCTPRCWNAKSKSCRCRCGGKAHGTGHPAEEVELAGTVSISVGIHTTLGAFYGEPDDVSLKAPSSPEYRAIGEKRKRSPEVDFGVWWRDGHNWPTYRVSWVEATGEVYAAEQQNYPQNNMQRVEILGRAEGRENVERVLAGWADACGGINSLQWVRDRLV